MSNSQSTNNEAAASSLLRQQTESQSVNDGDRTPRASGRTIGGMGLYLLLSISYVTSSKSIYQRSELTDLQSPLPSATTRPAALAQATPRQIFEASPVGSLWTPQGVSPPDAVTSIPSSTPEHP